MKEKIRYQNYSKVISHKVINCISIVLDTIHDIVYHHRTIP